MSKEGAYQMAVRDDGRVACAVHTNTQPAFWHYGSTIPTGAWRHIACTYDSDGAVRVYVEGALTHTSSVIGGAVENSGAPLLIGRRTGGAAFDGRIDEAGVWERALSAAELQDVRTNGVAATYGALNQRGDNRELCDGMDNNCNAAIDETYVFEDPQGGFAGVGQGCDGDDSDWCADEGGVVSCSPDGYGVSCSDDPNDNDVEICDGLDNDCRFGIDDQLVFIDYFPDVDGDNFGDGARGQTACAPPSGDWVTNGLDCSDVNASVRPGGAEVCDGFDNDCDGTVDDGPLPGRAETAPPTPSAAAPKARSPAPARPSRRRPRPASTATASSRTGSSSGPTTGAPSPARRARSCPWPRSTPRRRPSPGTSCRRAASTGPGSRTAASQV